MRRKQRITPIPLGFGDEANAFKEARKIVRKQGHLTTVKIGPIYPLGNSGRKITGTTQSYVMDEEGSAQIKVWFRDHGATATSEEFDTFITEVMAGVAQREQAS